MSVIEVNNLHKDFGGLDILKNITFSIEENNHIALIGRNGCGKTTLLRILMELDDDYKGSIKKKKNCIFSYVPQLPPPFFENETASDYILRDIYKMRQDLEELTTLMADDNPITAKDALQRYSILREKYDSLDGDLAEDQTSRILAKAGLLDRMNICGSELSGGEKNLLIFLKAVRKLPDILILDEPGNHLDMAGLSWLEEFVSSLPYAVLMVSHDRRMVDKIADTIFELEDGKITTYTGNYSSYRLEKLKKVSGQGKDYQADKKKIERLEALVKRFAEIARSRADPAWGKRLHAKRSQLERAKNEATEKPELGNRNAQVIFNSDISKADIALRTSNYKKSYGDEVIIENSNFTILNGERVALIGSNGCGKTSFIKDMISFGSWDNPVIQIGPSMLIGYCSQTQDIFNKNKTVEEEFLSIFKTEREILNHIGKFLFTFNDLHKSISSMSGGELNRLQLAMASAKGANFLVLDEPTNHLDIPTREAVEDAIIDFKGTVLVVSHDRYFLEKIANRVIFIENKKMNEYEGSFMEYWRDVGRNTILSKSKPNITYENSSKAKSSNKSSNTENANSIEEQIEKMEKEKEAIEKEASKAFDNGDYIKASEIAEKLALHNKRLQKLWDKL